jgi:hypothetical protein
MKRLSIIFYSITLSLAFSLAPLRVFAVDLISIVQTTFSFTIHKTATTRQHPSLAPTHLMDTHSQLQKAKLVMKMPWTQVGD